MRFAIGFLALLGTLCFAWEESSESFAPFQDPGIPDEHIAKYWEEASKIYKELYMEQFRNGTLNNRRNTKTTPFSEMYSDRWNTFEIFSDMVTKKHNITKRQAAGTANPAQCSNPAFNCANAASSRYRTFDGTCNNMNNPVWGATNRAVNRLLSPVYEDGFSSPRGGFSSRLPNPRVISYTVDPDSSAIHSTVTNMVPQFGQFLDHDITLTPSASTQCCANPNSDSNCWSIPVLQQDPFFSRFTNCLDFTRSTPCIQNGVRQQMNANTAFIDGSQIYGSTNQRVQQLRSFSGGLLRTNPSFQGFLPFGSGVGVQAQGDFAAGDDRINEMPSLAVMHNVWLMEHNRIANGFRSRTSWSDERIFQETRRIVIAELQQVTYNEYLPIILGANAMNEYDLGVSTWTNYQSNVDPTIVTEFATASYRFGHSMVSGIVQLLNAQNQQVDSFQIADQYFESGQITRNNGQGYDMILRGLMKQNSPQMDRFVTTGVTNFLFKAQNAQFGGDLVARNIQRGRDHGCRNYNAYRMQCGGSDLTNAVWGTVPPNINPDGWAQAAKIYRSPSDIDLFVGGLIEIPVAGGLTGPTFTCLNSVQFSRLKFGDRYFFTHNLGTGFTAAQLTDITKRRLSDIICDNSQQPDAQANVFKVPGSDNPNIPCGPNSGRPQINFNNYL